MSSVSWWVGLSRDELHAAAERETPRMAADKNSKLYTPHPGPSPDPPRRRQQVYTYALEQEAREA